MFGIEKLENGQLTFPVSYIDCRAIKGQIILNEKLVTEFRETKLKDGAIMHPAGVIVCDQPTQSEKDKYNNEFSDIESETVTRLGKLFWDRGAFTPYSEIAKD